jgi:hypothetical protein
MDCSHTALASRCGQRQTWVASSTGASHLGYFELDRCFQSFIIFPVPQIPEECLTIQWRVVKATCLPVDVGTSRLAETVAGVPMLFGVCPLNEAGNLVSQVPTLLSRANPERPRLSVDLPHWTVSVFGVQMPVNLGCQIHVNSKKKSPSVQKNRTIVVFVVGP